MIQELVQEERYVPPILPERVVQQQQQQEEKEVQLLPPFLNVQVPGPFVVYQGIIGDGMCNTIDQLVELNRFVKPTTTTTSTDTNNDDRTSDNRNYDIDIDNDNDSNSCRCRCSCCSENGEDGEDEDEDEDEYKDEDEAFIEFQNQGTGSLSAAAATSVTSSFGDVLVDNNHIRSSVREMSTQTESEKQTPQVSLSSSLTVPSQTIVVLGQGTIPVRVSHVTCQQNHQLIPSSTIQQLHRPTILGGNYYTLPTSSSSSLSYPQSIKLESTSAGPHVVDCCNDNHQDSTTTVPTGRNSSTGSDDSFILVDNLNTSDTCNTHHEDIPTTNTNNCSDDDYYNRNQQQQLDRNNNHIYTNVYNIERQKQELEWKQYNRHKELEQYNEWYQQQIHQQQIMQMHQRQRQQQQQQQQPVRNQAAYSSSTTTATSTTTTTTTTFVQRHIRSDTNNSTNNHSIATTGTSTTTGTTSTTSPHVISDRTGAYRQPFHLQFIQEHNEAGTVASSRTGSTTSNRSIPLRQWWTNEIGELLIFDQIPTSTICYAQHAKHMTIGLQDTRTTTVQDTRTTTVQEIPTSETTTTTSLIVSSSKQECFVVVNSSSSFINDDCTSTNSTNNSTNALPMAQVVPSSAIGNGNAIRKVSDASNAEAGRISQQPNRHENQCMINVIGSLHPGMAVIGYEIITVDSISLEPLNDIDEPMLKLHPLGKKGWIQFLKIHCDNYTSFGYVVYSIDGYTYLGAGTVDDYTQHNKWYWRVTNWEGAFVRSGLDLSSTHCTTLPYGSIVQVLKKSINLLGIPRLYIRAYYQTSTNIANHQQQLPTVSAIASLLNPASYLFQSSSTRQYSSVAIQPQQQEIDSVVSTHGARLECLEGWCSECYNPLSGQRGKIVRPLPLPVPAVYTVTHADGVLIRNGIELASSPTIRHVTMGQRVTVLGRVFSEYPTDQCLERLKLLPSLLVPPTTRNRNSNVVVGEFISTRLNVERNDFANNNSTSGNDKRVELQEDTTQPQDDPYQLVKFYSIDPSFDPSSPITYYTEKQRLQEQEEVQSQLSSSLGAANAISAMELEEDRDDNDDDDDDNELEELCQVESVTNSFTISKTANQSLQQQGQYTGNGATTHCCQGLTSVPLPRISSASVSMQHEERTGRGSNSCNNKKRQRGCGVRCKQNCSNSGTKVVTSDSTTISECLICLSEPCTATIVHGNTGHIVCCLLCARILHAQKEGCPVCRLPIDTVIQHFYA